MSETRLAVGSTQGAVSARPEVAETRRHNAYGALVMARDLLHTFEKSL